MIWNTEKEPKPIKQVKHRKEHGLRVNYKKIKKIDTLYFIWL